MEPLLRPCVGCSQVDDHPRHVIDTANVGPIPWHMDCHASLTGCEVCARQIAGVPLGTIGDELRVHLTTKDEVVSDGSNS